MYFLVIFSYARLKAAIGEVTDQVKQTQDERRTGRDSRDQEKERPKSRERDRSERRRDREPEKDKHRKDGEKAHDNR